MFLSLLHISQKQDDVGGIGQQKREVPLPLPVNERAGFVLVQQGGSSHLFLHESVF